LQIKILVTGGAGLIGSNLVKRFVKEGHDLYVADNLWRGSIENLIINGRTVIDMKMCFHKHDLRDYNNCLTVSKGMDAVIHLADIVAGINFVFANEFFLYRANIVMNSHMLDAAIENNVKKYVYVGTACSYPAEMQSELNPPPFVEEDAYPANPESAYGWSKLMGEYECELAQNEGAIQTSILRLHNVYGPPCEMSPEKSQVIPALIRKAVNYPKEEFIVWGSGNQRRAFLYVDDAVEAIIVALDKGMNNGVIQIGPGESYSIADIAERIVRLSGKEIDIKFDPSMPEGDKDRTADSSKAHKILGWQQKVSLDEGLQHTYTWANDYLKKNL
jgi:nucleoside-diphosphate-sugar epimerase|tara:strand:- start:11739 stop:12731 length:993 start_codon:yes stop_codon:yes gene_type:complete